MRAAYFTLILVVGALMLGSGCDVIKATQVENAVLKALAEDKRTAEYDFEVAYQDDGSVLITGEVWQPEEIEFVTEIAKSVEGVGEVLNRCSVPEPGSNMMQDTVVNTPYL